MLIQPSFILVPITLYFFLARSLTAETVAAAAAAAAAWRRMRMRGQL
jgi:hypothetical protein